MSNKTEENKTKNPKSFLQVTQARTISGIVLLLLHL